MRETRRVHEGYHNASIANVQHEYGKGAIGGSQEEENSGNEDRFLIAVVLHPK